MIELSICIPSYNRALFLPTLLKSIVLQYDERVEIVICDNGSTDNTQEIVLSWQKNYPRIHYERFEINQGPDRCFLRSIELGKGPYCWFISDDDILEIDGLEKVLRALKTYPNLTGITVNHAAYSFDLQKRWIEPHVKCLTKDQLFEKGKECFTNLFLLFGFISAQVVQKKLWLEVTQEKEVNQYFNAYSIIYIIGRMIQKNPCWLYIHTPCVGWRSDNDSFAAQLGSFGRFKLDLTGYHTIATGLFKDDPSLYKKIMNQVASHHLFAHIRSLKLKSSFQGVLWQSIALCVSRLGNIYTFWYKLLPTLLAPAWLLKAIRPFYRKLLSREVS